MLLMHQICSYIYKNALFYSCGISGPIRKISLEKHCLCRLLGNLFFNVLTSTSHPCPLLFGNFPKIAPSNICFIKPSFLTVIFLKSTCKTCYSTECTRIAQKSLPTRTFILAASSKSLGHIKKHLQVL